MDNSQFLVIRPDHYPECHYCSSVLERISLEREKSQIKHGRLDSHEITITCDNNLVPGKAVMWATHEGIRFPKNGLPGFRVCGIDLSGGVPINCPALIVK